MGKFQKGFFVVLRRLHIKVEGNNIYSDCWAQEQLKYSIFQEPSLDAVDHYNRYQERHRIYGRCWIECLSV